MGARRASHPARLNFMVEPAYTVKALDESTWAAFAALVERNNGVFGGCWCMGFHPKEAGTETTPALNRERKLHRVRAGTAHAALVFDGDDCVGWCQFGAPDEVPRIKSRAAYEKGRTTLPNWRIACCYVGKGHRRQGVATAALAGSRPVKWCTRQHASSSPDVYAATSMAITSSGSGTVSASAFPIDSALM